MTTFTFYHNFPFLQTFISTGTNLTLLFCRNALSEDRPIDTRPTKENVDFELELGKVSVYDAIVFLFYLSLSSFFKVHLCSSFIMNGVCVKWIGWIDLETLSGKAKLLFDDHNAKVNEQLKSYRPNVNIKKSFFFICSLNITKWNKLESYCSSPVFSLITLIDCLSHF